jgi:hypothetical protein
VDINEIRKYCTDETIVLTQHLLSRMRERRVKYDDVVSAILSGEIIEDYPDDFPFPSCLVLSTSKYPIHIVCGLGNGKLFIVTAYKPSAAEWAAGWKERKDEAK